MSKPILTSAFVLLFASIAFSQEKNFIDQPYIEVSGTADSLVTPDEIFLKIIISERDSKDKTSVEEQETKMIGAFTSLGINTEKDLTTSDMLSNYKYYLLKKKDVLKSKEYILKVSSAAVASKVFIQLEDLGISNVAIGRVNHTNLENIENACRMQAILNAKAKAAALTKTIGQSVGNAILISDNSTSFHGELRGSLAGIQIRGYTNNNSSDKMLAPKMEFEKIKVVSTVSAKFILK